MNILKMTTLFLALGAVLMLTGCVTPVVHPTASGKSEVTIHSTTKSVVKDRIESEMANKGFNTTKSDDSLLVMQKPMVGMASVLLSSHYDAEPVGRVSYSLMQNQKNVRVIADLAGITNPGSAFEQRTDFNGAQDTVVIQDVLDFIKYDMEKR